MQDAQYLLQLLFCAFLYKIFIKRRIAESVESWLIMFYNVSGWQSNGMFSEYVSS